ncbi:MAG: hypothetical protein JEY94_11810 [Melioribacteraceae bacterium]|nr:hypothetical protein [Melioribacteraceae bacterium]
MPEITELVEVCTGIDSFRKRLFKTSLAMKLKSLQKIYFNNALMLSLVVGLLAIIAKIVVTGKLVFPYHITFLAAFIATYSLSLFEDFYAEKKLKRYKFSTAIMIRTIVYSSIIKFAYFIDITIDCDTYRFSLLEKMFQWESFSEYSEFVIAFGLPVTFLLLFAGMLSLIFQVNSMLGKGVLRNYIFGKYHQPKVEFRIFMFLDLKSSTTIAETLGHVKFSKFLQDFFIELDDAVVESKGTLFQYVGDEVVMVWEMEDGIKNCNFIRFFYLVDKIIDELKDTFVEKYGVFQSIKPDFIVEKYLLLRLVL